MLHPPTRMLALATLAALAGCAVPPPGGRGDEVVRCELAAPAGVVAALVGGALRQALPDGDPVPAAAAVVVAPAGDGSFTLAWQQRGATWLPAGSHRLGLALANPPDAPVRVTLAPRRGEGALAVHRGDEAIRLRVVPTATGSHLEGIVPAAFADVVQRACARTGTPSTAAPGLLEPNLAVWTAHRLATAAARHPDDDAEAHALRCAAAGLAPLAGSVNDQLAVAARRRGDLDRATDHAWQALLATADPRRRATLARELGALQQLGSDATAWRAAARSCDDHDVLTARALLHTARRLDPRPALDYRLTSDAHRREAAPELAQATALLAREHAGLTLDLPSFVAELAAAAAPRAPAAAALAAPAR